MRIELGSTRLNDLHSLGQSVWLDCRLPRTLLGSHLSGFVRAGISGLDTHHTDLGRAYLEDETYRRPMTGLRATDATPQQIYERLSTEDFRRAADCLGRVYRTSGNNGYVCVELPLALAHDVEGTLSAASQLCRRIERPNIMIKIPATDAGLIAMRRLIAAGINVNATFIFGAQRYRAVADAYMAGLEDRLANRLTIARVASVASVFVATLDKAINRELEAIHPPALTPRAQALRDKAGIAVAQFIYQRYKHMIAAPRWQPLAAWYAQPQRILWVHEDTEPYTTLRYVNALIGRDTVTAMSTNTLGAYLDHGSPAPVLERNLHEVTAMFGELEALRINPEEVSARLEHEHFGAIRACADSSSGRLPNSVETPARSP